jgi:transposase
MWRPRKRTPEQLEERRLEAGRLLRAGHLSQAEIARRWDVSRTAVRQGALKRRAKPGRPARLTPRQWQQLLDVLARGAIKAGFETERWTRPRVRIMIQRRFGVT